jgi:hypothetical protein
MREIDLQSRTLYAELLEQLQTIEASRTIANLKGTFGVKRIKGEDFIYFQHYKPGGQLEQVYIGRSDDKKVQRLMQEYETGKSDMIEMRQILKRLGNQIAMAVNMPVDKAAARVIRALSEAGVFRTGGVLVGTHAYKTTGIMLGVNWSGDTMATSDIDIAATKTVSVAVPMNDANIPAAIDSLGMGFFPVPAMDCRAPSTSFKIRNKSLKLDLLTSKTSESSDPVVIPRYGCAAAPLEYLSYLLENPVQAVFIDADPVLVNVPQPVRYALHKLIVSQARDAISRGSKSVKDLHQAYQLLSLIQETNPELIEENWKELIKRGPHWKKPAEKGLAQMEQHFGGVSSISGNPR